MDEVLLAAANPGLTVAQMLSKPHQCVAVRAGVAYESMHIIWHAETQLLIASLGKVIS